MQQSQSNNVYLPIYMFVVLTYKTNRQHEFALQFFNKPLEQYSANAVYS